MDSRNFSRILSFGNEDMAQDWTNGHNIILLWYDEDLGFSFEWAGRYDKSKKYVISDTSTKEFIIIIVYNDSEKTLKYIFYDVDNKDKRTYYADIINGHFMENKTQVGINMPKVIEIGWILFGGKPLTDKENTVNPYMFTHKSITYEDFVFFDVVLPDSAINEMLEF